MPPDSVSRSNALPTDRLVTPASLAEPWWGSFHETGDVSVLHVDLTPCVAREKRAMAWLDQQEQARCAAICFPVRGANSSCAVNSGAVTKHSPSAP